MCLILFVAVLRLWTWYLPVKYTSRQCLETERDDAVDTIQQVSAQNSELLAQISELQLMNDKTLKDRNSTRHEHGRLATEKIILENQLAQLQIQLQTQSDIEARCLELEASLERSEESLERSKRLRLDEDSERKALSSQATRAKEELEEVKTRLMLKVEVLRVDHREALNLVKKPRDAAVAALPTSSYRLHRQLEAQKDEISLLRTDLAAQKTKLGAQLPEQPLQSSAPKVDTESKRLGQYQAQIAELKAEIKAKEASAKKTPELTSLENDGDQANQETRIEELQRQLNAKDAAYKDLESRELENTRNQLAQIADLKGEIASANAKHATLHEKHQNLLTHSQSREGYYQGLLKTKDVEIERINAQRLEEHRSQCIRIKALEDDLEAKDNAMDVDTGSDHVCDHSRCLDQTHVCDHSKCINEANLREEKISSLSASLMGRNIEDGRHQTRTMAEGLRMEGLRGQLEDQKAVIEKLQLAVGTRDRDWAQLRRSLQLGEEHDLASVERLLCQWQSNSASQDHKCDHSACERRILADSNRISELTNSVSSLNTKLADKDLKIGSLTADNQYVSRKANQAVKATKDLLQKKEKELEAEKAGRQRAIESEREIAKVRFQSNNPLRDEVLGLRKALAEMTTSRDKSRDANETYRKQSAEARDKADQAEVEKWGAETERAQLVKLVEELQGKKASVVEKTAPVVAGAAPVVEEAAPVVKETAPVVEEAATAVEETAGVEEEEDRMETEQAPTASRKRRNDGEEDDPRPAKILRDE